MSSSPVSRTSWMGLALYVAAGAAFVVGAFLLGAGWGWLALCLVLLLGAGSVEERSRRQPIVVVDRRPGHLTVVPAGVQLVTGPSAEPGRGDRTTSISR
jgi:hypothetical protein